MCVSAHLCVSALQYKVGTLSKALMLKEEAIAMRSGKGELRARRQALLKQAKDGSPAPAAATARTPAKVCPHCAALALVC